MNVNVTGAYIYFSIPLWDGFAIHITQTTLSLIVVSAILITAMVLLGKNLSKRPSGKGPEVPIRAILAPGKSFFGCSIITSVIFEMKCLGYLRG